MYMCLYNISIYIYIFIHIHLYITNSDFIICMYIHLCVYLCVCKPYWRGFSFQVHNFHFYFQISDPCDSILEKNESLREHGLFLQSNPFRPRLCSSFVHILYTPFSLQSCLSPCELSSLTNSCPFLLTTLPGTRTVLRLIRRSFNLFLEKLKRNLVSVLMSSINIVDQPNVTNSFSHNVLCNSIFFHVYLHMTRFRFN